MAFDRSKRAVPADKLESNEEIARKEKLKLEELEAARINRMNCSGGENSKSAAYYRSADALDDG